MDKKHPHRTLRLTLGLLIVAGAAWAGWYWRTPLCRWADAALTWNASACSGLKTAALAFYAPAAPRQPPPPVAAASHAEAGPPTDSPRAPAALATADDAGSCATGDSAASPATGDSAAGPAAGVEDASACAHGTPPPPTEPAPPAVVASVGDITLTRDELETRLAARLPADADDAARARATREIAEAFVRETVLDRALAATPPSAILPEDRIRAMTRLEQAEGFGTDDDAAGRFARACRVEALLREQAPAFLQIPDDALLRARAEADAAHLRACDAIREEMRGYARRVADRTATLEALAHAFSDVTEVRTYPLSAVPAEIRDVLVATPTGSVSPVTEIPGGIALFKVIARDDVADRRRKADAVRARLMAGEDFSKIAAEVSDCPSGKATGGALGTLARGTMFPPFEKAAFSLPLDTISQPIETEAGYHILKVTARDEAAGTVDVFHILIGGVPTVRAVTLARRFPEPTPDGILLDRLRAADLDAARGRYLQSLLAAPDIFVADETLAVPLMPRHPPSSGGPSAPLQ